jgi:hypothetical protein
MDNFREWLLESELATKDKLEGALREYMTKNPPAKRCYYIPSPSKMDFDPNNPEHIKDEIGSDYDRSIELAPMKNHPTAFKCAGVADDLVRFLSKKGFRARKIAGWYGNTGKGFRSGYAPRLDAAWPPEEFRRLAKGRPEEHWWVEADGFYVDLTSAQFHPLSPKDQRDLVIRDKRGAFEDGEYAAVRRMPLGRKVPLPPEAKRMVDKIISLKMFSVGHSKNISDSDRLRSWILKNAPKYGLERHRADDIVRSIEEKDFYFADRRALEALFGEGFDDLEEDPNLHSEPYEFKPPRTTSRGTVRISGPEISLTSVFPDELEDNLSVLKDLIIRHNPEAKFSEAEKESYAAARGGRVYRISVKASPHARWTPELDRDLAKEKFKYS